VAALRVSASAGADGPVVVLSGEADPTTAAVLREMLAAQLDTGTRLVTVDASGLSFLDSASVRVLVLAARALQGRHGRLVLARPQPVVARLLEITGADRLLDVRELAGLTGGESRVEHECDLHRRRRLLAASVRVGGPQVAVGRHGGIRQSEIRRPPGQLGGGQFAERRGDSAATGPEYVAATDVRSELCAFCHPEFSLA
jgi:anti-anti-sigma factor